MSSSPMIFWKGHVLTIAFWDWSAVQAVSRTGQPMLEEHLEQERLLAGLGSGREW